MPGDPLLTPSRADPRTLVPAARAMYERGFSRSQVLQEIYGVDLPAEAALFRRDFVTDHKPLQATWYALPWKLMNPGEPGAPPYELSRLECEQVSRAYAMAPNLVLLGTTGYNHAEHGASLIAYDLDELRAGRSTVMGLPGKRLIPESGGSFIVFGPSLIDVYADLIVKYRKLIDHWMDTGFGSVSMDDIEEMDSHLEGIEAIRNELQAP